MKEYKVFNFNEDVNQIVVLIKSTEDLYYLQEEIYDELSKTKGTEFTVLIDLFIRNGFSFNRFVSLKYKGKENLKSFIINPREVSEQIKFEIRQYLKKHEDILENSALSKNTIEFVELVEDKLEEDKKTAKKTANKKTVDKKEE